MKVGLHAEYSKPWLPLLGVRSTTRVVSLVQSVNASDSGVPAPILALVDYSNTSNYFSSLVPNISFNVPNLSSYDSVQRARFGDVLTVFFTLSSGLGIPFSIEGTPLFAVYDSASNLISPPQAMNGWDSQPATTVRGYPTVDTSRFSGGGVYFVVGNFNLSDSSGLIKLTSVSITMLILS